MQKSTFEVLNTSKESGQQFETLKMRNEQIVPVELSSKNDETYACNANTICQTSGVKNEETECAERQS